MILPFTTFYKIRTTQSVGYSSWIYLESRFAYSLGFTGLDSGRVPLKKHDFFDYDLSFAVPILLSSSYPLTLQPQAGFAYMCETMERKGGLLIADRVVTHYTAPLIGLILGFEPTNRFSLRSGLNIQFPKAIKYSQAFPSSPGPKSTLTAVRHGIYFFFDATFQLNRHFELGMTLEKSGYSVHSLERFPSGLVIMSTAAANRTALTLGGQWIF